MHCFSTSRRFQQVGACGYRKRTEGPFGGPSACICSYSQTTTQRCAFRGDCPYICSNGSGILHEVQHRRLNLARACTFKTVLVLEQWNVGFPLSVANNVSGTRCGMHGICRQTQ